MLLFECRGFERPETPASETTRSAAAEFPAPYRCIRCGEPITTAQERIEMDGAHEHTFVNPAGVVYRIGCFGAAPGCGSESERTTEFTWFAGFAWSLAACRKCGLHLGWRFSSERGDPFFGLILDRLVAGTHGSAA